MQPPSWLACQSRLRGVGKQLAGRVISANAAAQSSCSGNDLLIPLTLALAKRVVEKVNERELSLRPVAGAVGVDVQAG